MCVWTRVGCGARGFGGLGGLEIAAEGCGFVLSLGFDLDLLIPGSPLIYFAAAGSIWAKVL